MEKNELRLPDGYNDPETRSAWYWGDMRVIVEYRVTTDSFMARFDRIDDGVQRNICFDSNDLRSPPLPSTRIKARDFGWLCTLLAVAAFKDGAVSEGKAAWVKSLI